MTLNTYAVGYINWMDYELVIELIKAKSPMEALWKHTKVIPHIVDESSSDDLPQNLSDAKTWFFDQDAMVDVVAAITEPTP